MFNIDSAPRSELISALEQLQLRHRENIARGLQLDLTRGKPGSSQLDLSNVMINNLDAENLGDLRNYGQVDGTADAKAFLAKLMGTDTVKTGAAIFAGGNASLSLMHYTLMFANYLGLIGQPWQQQAQQSNKTSKFICPVPGYDRHFSICEQFDIEMINVPMVGDGPDMNEVEKLVSSDDSIKGIWCVPRFSNPTGDVYSKETVERIAALPKLAKDQQANDNFLVMWDNAYAIHTLAENAEPLADIMAAAKSSGTLDNIVQFASTSKITFAGSGIAGLSSSEQTVTTFKKHFGIASIGPDKINQQRHTELFKDENALMAHMKLHADIIAPRFDAVYKGLHDGLADSGMGTWTEPKGGYFISFDTRPGLATKVIALCAEAGVKLTPAGSAFPYKKDPQDCNIRLAPTFPTIEDVEQAIEIFVDCVKLASLEQALKDE